MQAHTLSNTFKFCEGFIQEADDFDTLSIFNSKNKITAEHLR